MKTVNKAKLVIEALKDKSLVQEIKKRICSDDNADEIELVKQLMLYILNKQVNNVKMGIIFALIIEKILTAQSQKIVLVYHDDFIDYDDGTSTMVVNHVAESFDDFLNLCHE